MIYLQLFWEFAKAGLFAVGGGMATIPFLYAMSDKTGWFSYEQLMDMIAVSESTPGPIGINMATYVGFLTGGVPGAVTATLGLIFPSIVVVLIIAAFLEAFRTNRYVNAAFYGLRPASTAMISAAGLLVAKEAFFGHSETIDFLAVPWEYFVLAALLLLLTRVVKKTKGLHPIVFIAVSALAGIVFRFAGA